MSDKHRDTSAAGYCARQRDRSQARAASGLRKMVDSLTSLADALDRGGHAEDALSEFLQASTRVAGLLAILARDQGMCEGAELEGDR